MVSLLDLPIELLEDIASHAVPDRVVWSSQQAIPALQLRLIHPLLTDLFARAIFTKCSIVLNPRDHAGVAHFTRFAIEEGVARYATSLIVNAPNFFPTVHPLSPAIPQLLRSLCDLEQLEMNADGHAVDMQELPVMPRLKMLSLAGESLFYNLAYLSSSAPNLHRLDINAAASSGPPARPTVQLGNTNQTHGFAPTVAPLGSSSAVAASLPAYTAIQASTMPASLTHLHISNVNTPSVQTLLLDLPFQPVHFSFSLIHNYDLSELAMLLCRDDFCSRTVSVKMVKSRLVHPTRLKGFKRSLSDTLLSKDIDVTWND